MDKQGFAEPRTAWDLQTFFSSAFQNIWVHAYQVAYSVRRISPYIFVFIHSMICSLERVCRWYAWKSKKLCTLFSQVWCLEYQAFGLTILWTIGLSLDLWTIGLSGLRNTGRTPYRRFYWSQWKVPSLIFCFEFYVLSFWELWEDQSFYCVDNFIWRQVWF